jgi:alanine-glyoxylate transaminase/serine-glyoxylate transaminase/serine-pyruvate transaminase
MKGRKLLMIPGPIEFEPAVLRAMSIETSSHVAPDFITSFQYTLKTLKELLNAPSGQGFILSGSGTLAMDMAACNLTEKGDKVLVVATGYFGQRYANIFRRYGAEVTVISSKLGETADFDRIEQELRTGKYKLLSFTHVDTSTGVKVDAKAIGKLCAQYNVTSILDGVCSVAGEAIEQEAWSIDVVLTASQKALGVPPGLALLMVSPKAMDIWKNRKTDVANYYADFANWLPIMEAYEDGRPSYFGTPAVNLIMALETSLKLIMKEGMSTRFARHKLHADGFRAALESLGLQLIATNSKHAANTLSAIWYPANGDHSSFTKTIAEKDVIVAGGLLAEQKNNYFRVGHMGSVSENDLAATLSAIEYALSKQNDSFALGIGVSKYLQHIHSKTK